MLPKYSNIFQNRNLKSRITIRYMMALLLIACVMLLTYIVLLYQISSNKEDAYIINISGKQRMLSQRVALFASEIFHAQSYRAGKQSYNEMKKALDIMVSDHQKLSSGILSGSKKIPLSDDLRQIYESENGINVKMKSYSSASQEFLDLYNDGGLVTVRKSNLTQQIVEMARSGLLFDLNRAVEQYELEARDRVVKFQYYETAFIILGLFVLLMELIFIFRPMAHDIAEKTESLETTNKELVEFSYRISHDLRAPIVSSLGLVSAAQQSLDNGKTDMVQRALNHMAYSMRKLDTLINDVMTLTKMKLSETNKEYVLVDALIEQALAKLANLPDGEKIDIQIDTPFAPPIYVEKMYLQQSIENLISNAIKYSDFSKEHSFVKIKTSHDSSKYSISVRDNGIGIPANQHDKMFGMFQRFHPRKSFGSGLGLYLVKQNINRIGGTISYIPHEDGTEFIITIPFREKSVKS